MQQNKRLVKEYKLLQQDPPPFIIARAKENDLLDCHYIITGPPDSPYSGGEYHGYLKFPTNYPFSPPGIYMVTPNGRFQVNSRICLSISDYHPDTWNPAWSVATILTGLLSFMLESTHTTGATQSTTAQKEAYATASHAFNLKDKVYRELFPELADSTLSEKKKQEFTLTDTISNEIIVFSDNDAFKSLQTSKVKRIEKSVSIYVQEHIVISDSDCEIIVNSAPIKPSASSTRGLKQTAQQNSPEHDTTRSKRFQNLSSENDVQIL